MCSVCVSVCMVCVWCVLVSISSCVHIRVRASPSLFFLCNPLCHLWIQPGRQSPAEAARSGTPGNKRPNESSWKTVWIVLLVTENTLSVRGLRIVKSDEVPYHNQEFRSQSQMSGNSNSSSYWRRLSGLKTLIIQVWDPEIESPELLWKSQSYGVSL